MFSPRVLKGGPLGEMVQWADILAALFLLGHSLSVTVSLKELQRWVLRCYGCTVPSKRVCSYMWGLH